MASPPRVARVSAGVGAAAMALAVLGPLGARLGVVSSAVGFRIFGLGFLLGVLALPLGVAGLWLTRPARGGAGRPQAILGTALGAGLVAVVLVNALATVGAPIINDITTDPSDPPGFRGRDLPYPGESFAPQQRAAYPDLEPITLSAAPDAAFAAATESAAALGWKIEREDGDARILEATDTSFLFRFVDDVSVRVRPRAGGSVVDLRSRSREGRGDLGANAARIRAFRDEIRKRTR